MKLVTFARTMAPHGVGDTRLVSDELADELEAQGALSEAKPWPDALAPRKPVRPQDRPRRAIGAGDRRLAR